MLIFIYLENNYEIIVINNNSTDKTKDIIYTYKEKNKKIKYVFEPRRSRGAARNKGIITANGDVITMTDCDCIVPENWIASIIKPIIEDNELIVMGSEDNVVKNYWTKNIQEENDA